MIEYWLSDRLHHAVIKELTSRFIRHTFNFTACIATKEFICMLLLANSVITGFTYQPAQDFVPTEIEPRYHSAQDLVITTDEDVHMR